MKKLVPKFVIFILLVSIVFVLSKNFNLFQKENPQTSSQKTSEIVEYGHVILAAGDIGKCDDPEVSNATGTAKLLDKLPGTIVTVGDNVQNKGTKEEFETCFHPTWGKHKNRIFPSIGNHDYRSTYIADATSYYEYFGEKAGKPGKGYYSFDLGNWHLIAINMVIATNKERCLIAPAKCDEVLKEVVAQEKWLENDLRKNQTDCTLIYGHYPRFSSGINDNGPEWTPLWKLLYSHNVDVFLVGSSHIYERFAPQDPEGMLDKKRGIRQFIVGTGGGQLGGVVSKPVKNSEVLRNDTHGILKMTLKKGEYEWEFISTKSGMFVDKGKSNCH